MTVSKKQGTSKKSAELRRRKFVEAYIANGGNATEAAIDAGYSPKTAGQQGSRLLKDVNVANAIQDRRRKLVEKYELTTDMVTRSIVQELTFDPAKLYSEDGSLKALHELDEDTRMSLAGVEFVQFGSPDAPVFVKKVKWAQRHQAREHAMRFLGMFKEKVEITGKDGRPVQTEVTTKVVVVPAKVPAEVEVKQLGDAADG